MHFTLQLTIHKSTFKDICLLLFFIHKIILIFTIHKARVLSWYILNFTKNSQFYPHSRICSGQTNTPIGCRSSGRIVLRMRCSFGIGIFRLREVKKHGHTDVYPCFFAHYQRKITFQNQFSPVGRQPKSPSMLAKRGIFVILRLTR